MRNTRFAMAVAATYVGLGSITSTCACTNEVTFNKPAKEFTRKYSSTNECDLDYNMSNMKKVDDNMIKVNNKNLYTDAVEIFGSFRNLTEEEEKAYIKGLKKISSPTGRKLKI